MFKKSYGFSSRKASSARCYLQRSCWERGVLHSQAVSDKGQAPPSTGRRPTDDERDRSFVRLLGPSCLAPSSCATEWWVVLKLFTKTLASLCFVLLSNGVGNKSRIKKVGQWTRPGVGRFLDAVFAARATQRERRQTWR